MGLRLLLALVLASAPQAQPQDQGGAALIAAIESAAMAVDRTAIMTLGDPAGDAEGLGQFATTLTWPAVSRIIIKERDRTARDDGTLAVLWEVFAERGIEGRVGTWQAELSRV